MGAEIQRPWSAKAIARPTLLLLGLFSLVTLLANALLLRHDLTIRTAVWYPKSLPSFSDALAIIRRTLWAYLTFHISQVQPDTVKVLGVLVDRFHGLLCYAT